ncbi:BrnA antitoxin family protein [Kovacikia minuta CCNUW1]|uniref:BrnA antitoxin family protein n=1 Tax=Kovacikia minuta TaxID=2931930 RepID=UPI001CCA255A|nr:BrnA antitoxin family protein [Kovacikia minuta]UBF24817.1 BrnA antitoxin family protein [Kovacikia minuta CCNUW1]
MKDEDIDCSDIPEATEEQMAQAVLRVGGVPLERGKQQVNMLLDTFIVEYFRRKAGDEDYQVLINATLSEYIQHNPLH